MATLCPIENNETMFLNTQPSFLLEDPHIRRAVVHNIRKDYNASSLFEVV